MLKLMHKNNHVIFFPLECIYLYDGHMCDSLQILYNMWEACEYISMQEYPHLYFAKKKKKERVVITNNAS